MKIAQAIFILACALAGNSAAAGGPISPAVVNAVDAGLLKSQTPLIMIVERLDESKLNEIRSVAAKHGGRVEDFDMDLGWIRFTLTDPAGVVAIAALPGVRSVDVSTSAQAQEESEFRAADIKPGVANVDAAEMHFVPHLRQRMSDSLCPPKPCSSCEQPACPIVDGRAQAVALWEVGQILGTHEQFTNRVTMGDAQYCATHACLLLPHATHVAGTVGSAGIRETTPALVGDGIPQLGVGKGSQGMAPGVNLWSYVSGNSAWPKQLSTWARDELKSRFGAAPSAISNHSWGVPTGWQKDQWWGDLAVSQTEALDFGRYDQNAQIVDGATALNPGLIVIKSAGNDRNDKASQAAIYQVCSHASTPNCQSRSQTARPGADGDSSGFDTLTPWASAKNAIVVGARSDVAAANVSGTTPSQKMCSTGKHGFTQDFSSWGPTDDGRIKPDIVANGQALLSTTVFGKKAGYGNESGTSMAAPVVSGVAALLAQVYAMRPTDQQIAQDPHRWGLFVHRPDTDGVLRADMLKAVLIHTATDGTIQRRSVPPTYCAGWGSVDALLAAYAVLGFQKPYLLFRETGAFPVEKTLKKGSGPIRVTIAWIDPPSVSNNSAVMDDATRTLVNDLDLHLTSPDGLLHFPWKLDSRNPQQPAKRCSPASAASAACRNIVDNVEVVDVDTPKAGTWRVTVTAAPSAKGQQFAMVISGLEH